MKKTLGNLSDLGEHENKEHIELMKERLHFECVLWRGSKLF